MKKVPQTLRTLTLAPALLIALSLTAYAAYSGDISINQANIRFSNYDFMEGKTMRIYATVTNHSTQDLLGVVRFYDNDKQINGDQAISIFDGKTDDVFIDWSPAFGSHRIGVRIYPWMPEIDDPSNNSIITNVFAVQDTDYDGIPNEKDDDDDGDGVNDDEDDFPLNSTEQYDTDGDGVGDNKDEDNDNDEVPDKFDDLPLDPNETMDSDKDGIGDIKDTDDDDDGLTDNEEENIKTNPKNPDTDGDDFDDKTDAFPLNSGEWLDTDEDDIGNNTDTDDDNDQIADIKDEFPLNKGAVVKLKETPATLDVMERYTFDATPSYDEDGKIVTYIWEIDGKTIEGNAVNHMFRKTGRYMINLSLIDNAGQISNKNFEVNVTNIRLYTQIFATLIALLLAILIYLKYISPAKKPREPIKQAEK